MIHNIFIFVFYNIHKHFLSINKKQSKRYAEITLTRQFWMQLVFRIPFSKSRKSIYRNDLEEWVCQMLGVYRLSFHENKNNNQRIMQKLYSIFPRLPFNCEAYEPKTKKQSSTIFVISA